MSQRQVYRKKGENTTQNTEESKNQNALQQTSSDEVPHRGGRGGRGIGRGGRGGQRPYTSYQDRKQHQYQRKGEHHEGDEKKEGEERHHRNDNRQHREKKEIDENTYYYKYFYAPRPKFERVEVTAETEVPPVVPKDQRKKQPDQNDFDKKMKELDNQIDHLKNKIRQIGGKKKEVLDGGKVGNTSVTYKDFLAEKIEAVNKVRAEKRKLLGQMTSIRDKIQELEADRQNLRKELNRDLQDPEKIQKAIQELEKRFETTTLKNAQEEKKVLAEIKKLKASIPSAQKLIEIKPKADKLYDEKKVIKEQLDTLQADIDSKDAEITQIKKEMDEAREKRADIKEQLDKFEEDIAKVKEDLQGLFNKKTEIREEYYKAKLEFELEREEIHHAEKIAKEKQRLIEKEKQRLERIEARKQALLDRPNPYLKEIETCEHLIGYCQKLKIMTGLVELPAEEQIKQEQKQIITQLNKDELNKKLNDGKLERVMTKQEREQQALIQVGSRTKNNKQKKNKQKNYEVEEAFNIDITMINKFSFLKISPPLNKEALDAKIKELQEKLVYYEREGEARLKEEEEKLKDGELIEDEVEEKEEHDDYPRRGGRGGFRGGRGARGGRGRPTTQGGDRRGGYKRDRDEVVEEDDEDAHYSQPIHNKERRTNKKENLAFNEDNYPGLS